MALTIDQLISKAKSHERKGETQIAAQLYRTVLQQFPNNKRAHNGLQSLKGKFPTNPPGTHSLQEQINALIALLQKGQLKAVIQHANPIAHHHPNAIALYDIMGIAHMGLKNYGKSIDNYHKALMINPDFPEAHHNLGAALKATGQLDEAITCYQKALQLKPNYAEAHNNLGIALQEKGSFDAAIASYNNALQIAPKYADAHFNLGSALKEIGSLGKSITSFESGLSINPNNAEAYNHLGNAQQMHGCIDDAAGSYKKALQINPDLAEAYLNLGTALMALGDPDDAVTNYQTALKLKPDNAQAYRHYTSAIKFKAEDDYTARIAELLKTETISQNDRMHLSFALGKVKLDLGKATEAIKLLQTGNALRKEELNYDISIDQELFTDIKNAFSAKKVTTGISFADKLGTVPVFILGMPRSGTTLVEQIISSHSDVHGAGELRFMDWIMDHLDWENDISHTENINTIRNEYCNYLSGLNTDQHFVTDKMPANFRWLGFIAQAFPEAKIIHVTRDPAAVCWSIYNLFFPTNGMQYSFSMEDIARYYALYQDLMKFWNNTFPNRIYDLNYEQLTENQVGETQKLLAYLELDWEDTVIDFHESTRIVTTASNQQVRTKMYKGSSHAWEKYKAHLEPMLDILKELPNGKP